MSNSAGDLIAESAGAFATAVFTVGTSAVELFTGGSRSPRRTAIRIYNDGNNICYIGGATVTSSGSTKGEPLDKKQSITYALGDAPIYAITASSTTSLIVTETATV